MIVELFNTVSFQDGNTPQFNVPEYTLARASYEGGNCQSVKAYVLGWRLTFPMYPKDGIPSRCFPFREHLASNEPRRSPFMVQFTGSAVVFPRIRGR